MGTNDSLSNYIFSVAGRTTKSISGYKSIVKGTIISQSYNNYKVQIAGGADEVTAQTLGSGSYKKDDSVYLLETAVSGGESNAISKYFIISLTEEADPMANVTLRDSFEPKGTEYTVDDNKTEIEDVSLINELKQYGAFKLSFNVTLPEGTKIQDGYLLLKLMTDDNTLYDCKSSLGDWRGDIQARLMDVLQEQVYFLEGASINNIDAIELMKSTDFVFSNITITPGVVSRNSDDFTATLTCSQNDQSKDYVQLDEDSLILQTSIYYNDKSLYASGIKYYWQRYDKNIEKWIDLNNSTAKQVIISSSNYFEINYIQSDDNNFVISGRQLPYYNNKLRCVCYYGNVEIVTNTIELKNFTHIDYKVERYDTKDNIKTDITNNTRYTFNSKDEAIQISALITAEEFKSEKFCWGIRKSKTGDWSLLITENVEAVTNENTGATEVSPLDPANVVTLFGNGKNMKDGTKYITICTKQTDENGDVILDENGEAILIEVGEENIELSKNFGLDGFSPTIDPVTYEWITGEGSTGVKAKGEDGANIASIEFSESEDKEKITLTITDTNENEFQGSFDTSYQKPTILLESLLYIDKYAFTNVDKDLSFGYNDKDKYYFFQKVKKINSVTDTSIMIQVRSQEEISYNKNIDEDNSTFKFNTSDDIFQISVTENDISSENYSLVEVQLLCESAAMGTVELKAVTNYINYKYLYSTNKQIITFVKDTANDSPFKNNLQYWTELSFQPDINKSFKIKQVKIILERV